MITVVTIINSNFFPCVMSQKKKKIIIRGQRGRQGQKDEYWYENEEDMKKIWRRFNSKFSFGIGL